MSLRKHLEWSAHRKGANQLPAQLVWAPVPCDYVQACGASPIAILHLV